VSPQKVSRVINAYTRQEKLEAIPSVA